MPNAYFGSSPSTGAVMAMSSCIRWKIDNFSNIDRDPQHFIFSPVFTVIDSQIQFRLKMYPNYAKNSIPAMVKLSTGYCSLIELTGTIEFSILNDNNEKRFTTRKTIKLLANSGTSKWDKENYCFLTIREAIDHPTNRMLADDCLTISFDILFHNPVAKFQISIGNDKEYLKNNRLKDFDDFGKLLENGQFSDVKFVVGDKEIRVHKAILASRSPVFDAMFQHDMQENTKNIVNIVDIEYGVMMELFRFIYTDKVSNIELVACELLITAEKYCVERLKSLCEMSLSKGLKVDNALEYLVTADNCHANNLKKKTLEFIVNQSSRVVERQEFDLLHADLVREITRAMAQKQTKD